MFIKFVLFLNYLRNYAMKLPNRETAYIPSSKLADYLLSQTHAIGKSKAKFFQKLGFDTTNVDAFERGLREIAQEYEITEQISILQGEKYIIDGVLQTPIGRLVNIKTVWIIEKDEINPRFVTAYPA